MFSIFRYREGKPSNHKKYLPLGLVGTPGLFQQRKGLCCLACALKRIGMKPWLLRYFVRLRLTAESILRRGTACFSDVRHHVTDEQQRRIFAICQTMVENAGGSDVPNVHYRYYQAKLLKIISPYDGVAIRESEILPGQILEIFFLADSIPSVTRILHSLKDQAWDVKNPSNVYTGLDYPSFDKCVCICQELLPFAVEFSPERSGLVPDRCQILQCNTLDKPQRLLVHVAGLSLLVIDKIKVDPKTGNVTGVKDWLDMISLVHDMDSLFTVVLIQVDDFYEIDIANIAEIRTMVNQDLSEPQRESVFCLNVFGDTLELDKLVD